jgi:hypothetical protein
MVINVLTLIHEIAFLHQNISLNGTACGFQNCLSQGTEWKVYKLNLKRYYE